MTDMMVKIMVEVLDILGTATKEMKQSRASEAIHRLRSLGAHVCLEKFVKKIAGITKLEDGLKNLDKMTNEEARMANAEVMRLAHVIDKKVEGVDEKVQGVGAQVTDVDKKVQGVDEKVQGVGEKVQNVDEKVQGVDENVKVVEEKVLTIIDGAQTCWLGIDTFNNFELSRWQASGSNHAANGIQCRRCKTFVTAPILTNGQVSNTITGWQLREGLRKWQSPSDPSTNHNFASDRHHEGTAEWFCKGGRFEEWKVTGSLLWIHGKRTLL